MFAARSSPSVVSPSLSRTLRCVILEADVLERSSAFCSEAPSLCDRDYSHRRRTEMVRTLHGKQRNVEAYVALTDQARPLDGRAWSRRRGYQADSGLGPPHGAVKWQLSITWPPLVAMTSPSVST